MPTALNAPLVDHILQAKRRNPDADTGRLLDEIDGLVYQLYGLSQEDIATVEASVGNRAARTSSTLEEPAASV